ELQPSKTPFQILHTPVKGFDVSADTRTKRPVSGPGLPPHGGQIRLLDLRGRFLRRGLGPPVPPQRMLFAPGPAVPGSETRRIGRSGVRAWGRETPGSTPTSRSRPDSPGRSSNTFARLCTRPVRRWKRR